MDYAMLHGRLWTTFGWNVFTGTNPNPRFLRNFPMQANGAEMLRLACCFAVEAGVKVCAPVHDAILIEAPIDELEYAICTTQALMADVSALVLDGFRLRSDAKVIKHPERYMAERGTQMWDTVWDILRDRTPCAPVHTICARVQLYLCMSAHPYNLISCRNISNTMDPIDLKRLVLTNQKRTHCSKKRRPPRHKPGESFLKGPIPWSWITRASQLPGRSLHVALGVWYLAGLTKKGTVKLSGNVLKDLGVDRYAANRGLKQLEDAGLVEVERHAGRQPIVTILDAEEDADQD
jgi:hypothetical protein